jgi:hypothetical protein
MSKDNSKMDSRCPRALECMPEGFCPLAVMRLRAIRTAERELTEEEEANLPGCPWAVNHQMSNYCFFKYISEYTGDKPPSDVEVASLNCISVDTVKKVEKSALSKIRETEEFKSLKESMEGDSVVNEHFADDDHKINR